MRRRRAHPLDGSLRKAILREAAWAESSDGDLERAASLFRAAADTQATYASGALEGSWRELSGLAYVTARTGDLEAARSLANDAGIAIEHAGDYDKIIGFTSKANELLYPSKNSIMRRVSMPDAINPWRAIYRATIAAALLDIEGKWAESELLLRESIVLYDRELQGGEAGFFEHGRDVEWTSLQRSELAASLIAQGRLLEAESVVRLALERAIGRLGRDSKTTALILNRFVELLSAQGRFDEARKLAGVAVSTWDALGVPDDSRLRGESAFLRAAAIAFDGDWRGAAQHYRDTAAAFAGNRQTFERFFANDPTFLLARVLSGDDAEVREWIEQARQDARRYRGDESYLAAELDAILAVADLGRGGADALFRLGRAVDALVTADRQSRIAGTLRQDRNARLRVLAETYLERSLGHLDSGVAHSLGLAEVSGAFELASFLQGRSVEWALARSTARHVEADPELATLIRAEQDAGLRLEAAYRLLGAVFARGTETAGRVDQVRADIEQLESARRSVRSELEQRFPEYFELINPRRVSVERAQSLLGDDETLVAFYVGANATYVWALTRDGGSFARAALGRAALESKVGGIRRALEPKAETIGDIPAFDLEAAYELYALLLEPVGQTWQSRRSILAVPHGSLGHLPLAVLVTRSPRSQPGSGVVFSHYRSEPWLGRSHAISTVPSLGALATLRTRRAADADRRAFAGFGNPQFANDGERVDATITTRSASRRNLALRLVPRTRSATSADLEELPPLPETADELRAIAAALGGDAPNEVYLGRAASEAALKRMKLDDRRVIVFATHGLVAGDLDGLDEPALALSSPRVTGEAEDGLLTMGEILGLELDADWIVLSACNTAAADGRGAEAVSGLGRAFFYAGARALLVSNWPVETTSASALTTKIFELQSRRSELSRADTLREAINALIDSGGYTDASGVMQFSYAHPIFWAPFTLVGDGG